MKDLGVDEVFLDRLSGKSTERPELKKMMEYIRRGDMVIVESISRFARNTKDLLNLVERLAAKGVEFVSKKEAIDTTTPTGKFMLGYGNMKNTASPVCRTSGASARISPR